LFRDYFFDANPQESRRAREGALAPGKNAQHGFSEVAFKESREPFFGSLWSNTEKSSPSRGV
jgi:hypothetical protein